MNKQIRFSLLYKLYSHIYL